MPTLGRTRLAIGRADNTNIREDLLALVEGAEIALANALAPLAAGAMRCLASLAIGLRRTLGPALAEAILDGLWEDCFDDAPAMLAELGYRKSRSARCEIRPGKPVGSAACEPADTGSCFALADGSGCLSSKGATFVWEAIAA